MRRIVIVAALVMLGGVAQAQAPQASALLKAADQAVADAEAALQAAAPLPYKALTSALQVRAQIRALEAAAAKPAEKPNASK